MLLLSSQQTNGKHRNRTVSSSPSFWIAQALGALLFCPPDSIERWLPMMAPLPQSISETQKRVTVDQILEDCWANGNLREHPNTNCGYDIDSTDEWIVDNQRLIRDEKELERNGQQDQVMIGTQRKSILGSEKDRDSATNKPAKKSAVDSLFSNYFLSIHLLFSLPTFGEDDDDGGDGMLFGNTPNIISSGISPSTMKPSTYGEITTLGTRQLFGAMGLLHSNRNSIPDCHFVDLGSGAGKLVAQAVLELSDNTVQRATGIELSPFRHQAAVAAKTGLLERLANKTENQSNLPVSDVEAKMELIEGDLFDVDLSTATHIYVASLCFPDALMLQLEELLWQQIAQQQKESDINKESSSNLEWIATLRPFPNDLRGIRPMIRFMEMSWTSPLGSAVYLYRCGGGNDKR